jgi:hypothetical protein
LLPSIGDDHAQAMVALALPSVCGRGDPSAENKPVEIDDALAVNVG